MIQISGKNRLFVFLFENETDREVDTKYYLSTAEIKDYNVVINGRNFFHQPQKVILKHMITLERLQLFKEMIT